ncbi:MAG: HEAT repeat domain-containing protein [Myxococcota bacterium]
MNHSLLEGMRSPDPAERRNACLAAMDDPSAVLLLKSLGEALGDREKSVVRAASDALVAIGRGLPETSGVLREALHCQEPRRRWGAAFTSARLAPPDLALLPALVEAMSTADGDVRWAAAKLVVEMGRLHPEVLAVVIGLARSAETRVVRRMATFCLRELAPDDPGATQALLEASRDADIHLKRAAFTALAAVLAPGPEVPARLLEALAEEVDPVARRLSALALAEIGARNAAHLPVGATTALRRAERDDTDPDLRRAAARALKRLETAPNSAGAPPS